MNEFHRPCWNPEIRTNSKVLIAGASGGIGRALVSMLLEGPRCTLGTHRDTAPESPHKVSNGHHVIDLPMHLSTEEDCINLVETFSRDAGGLDALVVLCGSSTSEHFKEMSASQWEGDIQNNLNIPFYLAKAAMARMENGGSVVLTGTESALHGASPTSFPYGVAKRATECLVQGLARDGAQSDITVNGLRMGFILSGTHERWQGKTPDDLADRARMVPLGRGGQPEEAAALITYLLSGWGRFITGQMIPLTGGDWL